MTQEQALSILKLGHNVFLTGAAGSGKTYVLNEFVTHLRKHDVSVAVTASTGIAATHLNGMTIHSWSGIGISDSLTPQQLEKLAAQAKLKRRIESTKVLIIDEVSMLHGKLLDLVDQVTRRIKKSDKPFGGLQVILSGDLFQLPPVTRRGEETDWVFESSIWNNMHLKICYLSEQHRQEDSQLLAILNAIRTDSIDQYHFEQLQERFTSQDQEGVTKLFTHNANVDEINDRYIKELGSEPQEYFMDTIGGQNTVRTLVQSCLAPQRLVLKRGAQVMFVANNPTEGYFNGTRGKVVGFKIDGSPRVKLLDGQELEVKKFSWKLMDGDKMRASISQFPLRLAWAITIHKSQGMTLDGAEVDLSRAFEPGMGYVALSRVRTLAGLHIRGANNNALRISPQIREFDAYIKSRSEALEAHLISVDQERIDLLHQKVLDHLSPRKQVVDPVLLARLKKWRQLESERLEIPPFTIFNTQTLKELASSTPQTLEELQKVPGVSTHKAAEYGTAVLAILTDVIH